jgi:hypothetical protein
MSFHNTNYLNEAINTVLDWDLPDALFSLAINDQAKLLAGFDSEELWTGDAMFNYGLGSY